MKKPDQESRIKQLWGLLKGQQSSHREGFREAKP
jgi:hypothetical protein